MKSILSLLSAVMDPIVPPDVREVALAPEREGQKPYTPQKGSVKSECGVLSVFPKKSDLGLRYRDVLYIPRQQLLVSPTASETS